MLFRCGALRPDRWNHATGLTGLIPAIRSTLRRYLARRLRGPEIPFALERLRSQGFSPSLVFDVGAYRGDFARLCLRVWPATRIACFEPQEHIRPELLRFADEHAHRVSVHPYLLGASLQNDVLFNEAETASSVLLEHHNQNHRMAMYDMKTVDHAMFDEFDGKSPDLLKVDVQGYELEVLKGAEKALKQVQAVLAEVNLLDIHKDVPLFAEMVDWLKRKGFVAFDICGLTRRPLDDALWQIDMIFVPEESPLRHDKHWKS